MKFFSSILKYTKLLQSALPLLQGSPLICTMFVFTGGALTLLVGCVPLLGQLIQFVILLTGLGAATVGLARRRAPAVAAPARDGFTSPPTP